MTMRFSYPAVRIPHPAVTLGGQGFRLRPLVNLTILGPGGTFIFRALLDTGSDEVVLPEAAASSLGIDLTHAPTNTVGGVGSPPFVVRYAPVRLRLTDGIEHREWPALVGFSPALVNRVLFGLTGGLQFFTATFHGDRAEVELSVNPSYPGT